MADDTERALREEGCICHKGQSYDNHAPWCPLSPLYKRGEATYAEFREAIRRIAKDAKQSPHALDALAFAGSLLDAAWRTVPTAPAPEGTEK